MHRQNHFLCTQMITWHNIKSYLRWQLRARDRQGHRVHSPFLFSLITSGLHKPIEDEWVRGVEQRRQQLLADRSEVAVTDYGSGSSFGNGRRRVCDIARHSSTSPRDGRLLCNLATAMHSGNILELGTNLGIGSLYLAHSANCSRLVTIEGCPNLSKIAAEGFKQLGTAMFRKKANDENDFPNYKEQKRTKREETPKYFLSALVVGVIFLIVMIALRISALTM